MRIHVRRLLMVVTQNYSNGHVKMAVHGVAMMIRSKDGLVEAE